jgi:hypothetical protein
MNIRNILSSPLASVNPRLQAQSIPSKQPLPLFSLHNRKELASQRDITEVEERIAEFNQINYLAPKQKLIDIPEVLEEETSEDEILNQEFYAVAEEPIGYDPNQDKFEERESSKQTGRGISNYEMLSHNYQVSTSTRSYRALYSNNDNKVVENQEDDSDFCIQQDDQDMQIIDAGKSRIIFQEKFSKYLNKHIQIGSGLSQHLSLEEQKEHKEFAIKLFIDLTEEYAEQFNLLFNLNDSIERDYPTLAITLENQLNHPNVYAVYNYSSHTIELYLYPIDNTASCGPYLEMLSLNYKSILKHELRHAIISMAVSDVCNPIDEYKKHKSFTLIPNSINVKKEILKEIDSYLINLKDLIIKIRDDKTQVSDIEKKEDFEMKLQGHISRVYTFEEEMDLSIEDLLEKNKPEKSKMFFTLCVNEHYVKRDELNRPIFIKSAAKLVNSNRWIFLYYLSNNFENDVIRGFYKDIQNIIGPRFQSYINHINSYEGSSEEFKSSFLLHELSSMLHELDLKAISRFMPRVKQLLDEVYETSKCYLFSSKKIRV